MIKDRKYGDEFVEIVGDILEHPKFQGLKDMEHHGNDNSVYEHSVAVGYNAFVLAKKLNLDYISVARGGLLHDFFFEDWREREKQSDTFMGKVKEMHGFRHPKDALENASYYFDINDKEADMIVKHMFPLTISMPLHAESWVVTAVDKGVAVKEMLQNHTPRKLYRSYKARYQN